MAFIKLTGEFLNEEFNSFFSAFGFTQEIGTLVPANLTTANQFNAEFLRLYQTAAKTVGWGDNRRQIPAQETIDYQPLKIVNLWSIWANVQDKPVEKQKFYLMDNKLLFFWVPRTKQGYSFSAAHTQTGRGAEFGKTAGGWFCLHRSPIADEEGNYPLKFGLPTEYTILGIMTQEGNAGLQQIVKQDEFAEMEPFKGIAYNWDFQGGIIYRSYGQAGREAVLGSMTRILENMDWYACISRRSNTNFKPVSFKYPTVIATGMRRRSPNKMSSINDKLKRTKNEINKNSQYVGREFTATCTTEKNLKSLMDELEGGEIQITYGLPLASYTSQATFQPLSIGNVLRNCGLNSSLSTPASNQSSSNRRMRESIEGRTPIGFATKITFDSESCLPLFSGRTESEWKKQRTPQPSPLAHEYGNIINYNYRIPQIMR
jgi:hypothetical protein